MKSKKQNRSKLLQQVPELNQLADGADHIDIKTVTGELSMRQFLANMFSYMPRWMQILYAVRWFFVRLLGMKQEGIPKGETLTPDGIPFEVGKWATFFRVVKAKEGEHWFAAASDTHLTAHLGLITEPLTGNEKRFQVVTLVHYHHWTGPLYFNVIRPFHHIVVNQMMKAAVQEG
ncbi:MAG: DUF2867 domain-containing protein [Chloroflexota bacterium]